MQATQQLSLKGLYGLIALYLAIACVGVVTEFFWILLLPAALLIVYSAFYKLDKLFFFIAFCTPLAINLSKTDLGIGVSLPTEPIIFGMMLIYLLSKFYEGRYEKNLVSHPIVLLIFLHLFWMLLTSLTSTMVMVSLKQFIARLWFISIFFFLAVQLFKKKENIRQFIWLYTAGMVITIIYTIIRHSMNSWTQQSAHWVMTPFYNDHTAYAAILALFYPPIIGLIFMKQKSFMYRFFAFLIAGLVTVALVLSYTRAAWLSVVVAMGAGLVFLFRIKTWIVITGIMAMLIGYQVFQSTVLYKFEKTKEYSQNDYRGHLKSITNIKTDASNVERINRWSCAWRMFLDKPFLGWGPGTYQFNYAGYQRNEERSYISTNLGDKGNAHSEYLGPLCEQGFMGTLIFVALGICVIYRASRVIVFSKSREIRILALTLLLGLITYWIHGFLNNFLDTDKASVPFWAFIAAITVMDFYHMQAEKSDNHTKLLSDNTVTSSL